MVSEQHPRKQGLKPEYFRHEQFREPGSQSNIQENKDWNDMRKTKEVTVEYCLRATSKKTRIETLESRAEPKVHVLSQSNIQENKDWNHGIVKRIDNDLYRSQSNIQENKDWNSHEYI